MKYVIEINMDNAAFENNEADELARILTRLADRLQQGGSLECSLHDINGNKVGSAEVRR